MSGPKPPEVPLSDDERQQLLALVRAPKTSQQLAFRARLILRLADGLKAAAVARGLQTTRKTVRLWRQPWLGRRAGPVAARLQDAARAGAPATLTAEQGCQIMALACEPPAHSQRPLSHWTPRELADEAVKRGLVGQISPRHVGRFLKSGRVEAAPESLLAQRRTRGAGERENHRGDDALSAGARLAGGRRARARE